MSLKSVDTCFLVSSRTRSKRAHNRYEASVHFGPVPFRGRLSDRNSVRTELRGWHNIGAMLPTQLGRSMNAFRSTPRFLVRPFRQEHADPRVHTIVCLGAGPRNPEPGSRAAPPRGLGRSSFADDTTQRFRTRPAAPVQPATRLRHVSAAS